jgi:hypothetical protein
MAVFEVYYARPWMEGIAMAIKIKIGIIVHKISVAMFL